MRNESTADEYSAFLPVVPIDDAENPLCDFIRYTEFKRLLGQIVTAQTEQGFKTVAVISNFPGEGKTFLTSALALGFSRLLHKRVLVINTVSQTHHGSVLAEHLLGPHSQQGLRQRASASDQSPGAIDLISTKSIVGEGKNEHDSADFQIGPYIDTFRDNYDVIFFDTCALSKVKKTNIDPIIISKHTDASVLVLSKRSLKRDVLNKVKSELQRRHIFPKLLGTIFNCKG